MPHEYEIADACARRFCDFAADELETGATFAVATDGADVFVSVTGVFPLPLVYVYRFSGDSKFSKEALGASRPILVLARSFRGSVESDAMSYALACFLEWNAPTETVRLSVMGGTVKQ